MNWEEAHQVTSGLLLYSMYHTGAKWVTLLPELDEYFVIGHEVRGRMVTTRQKYPLPIRPPGSAYYPLPCHTTLFLDKFNSKCYHFEHERAKHHHTDPDATATMITVQDTAR